MKRYRSQEKPFVYAAFSGQDREEALAVLESIREEGVEIWYSEKDTRGETGRIEAACSCVLFLSGHAMDEERILRSARYAVLYHKKILCVYLEPVRLSPGQELLLNSLQSLAKHNFADEQAFLEKLKSAEVFSHLEITPAQKRFARRRALASVFVPVAAATVLFFAVVVPLLIAPLAQAKSGTLSQVGFGNLTLSELGGVKALYIIGPRSYDQWYYAFYRGETRSEVYVNGLEAVVPMGNIVDISDFSLLKNAKEIAIEANQVTDISPLYSIQSLEALTLNCNPIRSIEGIQSLQNLNSVNLVYTKVSDISPLFEIPSLSHISFEETYVNSIEGIEKLPHLMSLRTGNSNLTDLSPLNAIDFSYVEESPGFSLEAKRTQVRDFSPLTRIPKFNEIMITLDRVDRLLPSIQGKQVRFLMIGQSDIRSIEELSSLQGLEKLYLPESRVLTSLEGIQAHESLREIQLSACPALTDYTPLLALPNLERLIVSPDMGPIVAEQLAGANFEIIYQD